jgi:hypothetical protein
LITNEIEAIEVLNRKGRETIKNFYRQNSKLFEENNNMHLTSLLEESEKLEKD